MTLKSSNKLRTTSLEYNLKHSSNLKPECNPQQKESCTVYVSNWFSLSALRDFPRWRLVSKHGKSLKQLITRLYYVLNSCVVFTIPLLKLRSQIIPWLTSWIPPKLDRGHVRQISGQQSMIIPVEAATCNKHEHLGHFLSYSFSCFSSSYTGCDTATAPLIYSLEVHLGRHFPKQSRPVNSGTGEKLDHKLESSSFCYKDLNPSFFCILE